MPVVSPFPQSVEFRYDPAHPTDPMTWTVPGGVAGAVMWAAGGGSWWDASSDTGEASPPWRGLRFSSVPLAPGDELTVVLGGASTVDSGGTNGGGAGGGGLPEFVGGWRGYGGGGATEISRNGDPWMVAAGMGGAVGGGVSTDMVRFTTGDTLPSASDPPRLPVVLTDEGNPHLTGQTAGVAGGVHDGAAGVLTGDGIYGSGGGGAGFGGGSSGPIGFYEWLPPDDMLPDFVLPRAGLFGGFLVPAGAEEIGGWDPSADGSGIYPSSYGGHGWVRIDLVPSTARGWSVGRLKF